MAGQTRAPPHKPSNKLSEEENQAVFKMLDLRCLAQATAVVQMYGTEPPHHNSWYKIHCGVATFTKDNIRKSFFIQVYDFATGQRVFEQEIYREFSYHDSRPHFHQFESDEKMIGFNFADETDSRNFHAAVSNLLLNRKRKREERMRQGMQRQQQELRSAGNQPALTMAKSQETVYQPSNNKAAVQKEQKEQKEPKEKRKFNLNRKGKDKKKNLRKDMIGEPTNFLHVSHAGFDRDHNFSQFNVDKTVDDELKDFFRAVGLKQQQMEDPAMRQFVYDFINKSGGLEEAKRENQKYSIRRHVDDSHSSAQHRPLPPLPPSAPAPPPPPLAPAPPPPTSYPPPPPALKQSRPLPPPPPERQNYGGRSPGSRIHAGMAPPPPPPVSSKTSAPAVPAPPPPPPPAGIVPPPPPPPPAGIVPPPPPPPTAGLAPPPPPPPPPSGSSAAIPPPPPHLPSGGLSSSADPRSALLHQIQEGKNLRRVNRDAAPAPPLDSRGQLLEDIKLGVKLRKVEAAEAKEADPNVPAGLSGMALDLHRALQERSNFIALSDSEDSSGGDDDDDEWDDDD